MPELRLPHEGQHRLDLAGDELAHDVPRVHVDRADGHDLLPVALGQRAQEQRDQVVQLRDLLLVVVFDRIFVALLNEFKDRGVIGILISLGVHSIKYDIDLTEIMETILPRFITAKLVAYKGNVRRGARVLYFCFPLLPLSP